MKEFNMDVVASMFGYVRHMIWPDENLNTTKQEEKTANNTTNVNTGNVTDPNLKEVTEIVDYLSKASKFAELTARICNRNIKVTIRPLDQTECKTYNVIKSCLLSDKGDLFREPSATIMYRQSLPFPAKLQCVLMEYCNLDYIDEMEDIDSDAYSGNLSRSRYAIRREEVEYKAFKDHVTIGTSLEGDKATPRYSIISKELVDASGSFENYLQMVTASGHIEDYALMYSKIKFS